MNKQPFYRNTIFYITLIFVGLIIIHFPWTNFNGIVAGDTGGYVDVSIG